MKNRIIKFAFAAALVGATQLVHAQDEVGFIFDAEAGLQTTRFKLSEDYRDGIMVELGTSYSFRPELGVSPDIRGENVIADAFCFLYGEAYVPTSISVTWAKKRLLTEPTGWYTCEGTAKVTATGAAKKFDWQILNLTTGGVDAQKFGIGKTWFFGYIEPMNDYQIQVRESGTSNWFTKSITVPDGCGIK